MIAAAELLDRVRAAGGTATVAGQYLKLRASRPLPTDLMDMLREHKSQIIAYLAAEGADDAIPAAMMVYEYRLSDNGRNGPWLTLLAPNCSLREARRTLKDRFGAGRVLAVRPHKISITRATT